MFRLVACIALLASASAIPYSYGGYGGYGGYGKWAGSYSSLGAYAKPAMYSGIYGGYGYGYGKLATLAAPALVESEVVAAAPAVVAAPAAVAHGPITTAVQHLGHKVDVVDYPSTFGASPALDIDVPTSSSNLNFMMRSRASDINVETVHESTPGSYKESAAEEEPHINRHTIHRPIVQEVREIISPYRKMTTEVQPVQEEMRTILPRGQQYHQAAYAAPVATAAYAAPVATAAYAAPVATAAYAAPVATAAYAVKPAMAAYAVKPTLATYASTYGPMIKSYGYGY